MIVLGWIVLILTFLRLAVVLANVLGKQWLRKGKLEGQPLVSVLIPARNEEKNIGKLLNQLTSHDYKHLEILVYDDLSIDRTSEIVKGFVARDQRVRLLNGKILPAGWLGKNHACYQLANQARGDFFLFLDADVSVKNSLLRNALGYMQKHRLKLLSLFPVQQMGSLSERLVVPLMNWILVSLLPLILTRLSSRESLAAANGQFMLFEAGNYRQNQYHELLRSHKVEDIAIFRQMKSMGFRVQTLLGSPAIQCRMYQGGREAMDGFSKNVFEFFAGKPLLAMGFWLITALGFIPVWLALPPLFTLYYFCSVFIIRLCISLASRQPVFCNLLLAPLQMIAFGVLIAYAFDKQRRKVTQWKGRNIDIMQS